MKRFPIALALTILATGMSNAQDGDIFHNSSAEFRSGASKPAPNAELPPHVVATAGKVTMFADYEHRTASGVPIYLVNRTRKTLPLATQDGALFLKLEAETTPGVWQRAQDHVFSRCGNSYYPVILSPGQHMMTLGYQPGEGVQGRVRFNFQTPPDIESNAGPGLWRWEDIEASAENSMVGNRINDPGGIGRVWNEYAHADKEDPWPAYEDAIAWLDLVSRRRSDDAVNHYIGGLVSRLESDKRLEKEQTTAALARLNEFRNRSSEPDAPLELLRGDCLVAIRSDPPIVKKVPGNPASRPWIAWNVIRWSAALQGSEYDFNSDDWDEVFKLAESRFPKADSSEKLALAEIYQVKPLAAEHVTRDFLIKNALVPILGPACIELLAYHEAYVELARIGKSADLKTRLLILKNICAQPEESGQRARLRTGIYNPDEKAFWESCIKDSPWLSLSAMRLATGYPDTLYLEPGFSLMFRAAYENLLESSEKIPFPLTNQEELSGARFYIAVAMRDPGVGSIRLLKRTVDLRSHHPDDEPEPNAKARSALVATAGRELRMEEFFR